MKNPYTYTLSEVLGLLPEWRNEIESIIDQIEGYNTNMRLAAAELEMQKRRLENEKNQPKIKEKPLTFDMGAE